MAAVRAHEAVGPAPMGEGVEALVFGTVEGEELVEADAFLELHGAARHVIFLFLSSSYMATFYTKCSLHSRGNQEHKWTECDDITTLYIHNHGTSLLGPFLSRYRLDA